MFGHSIRGGRVRGDRLTVPVLFGLVMAGLPALVTAESTLPSVVVAALEARSDAASPELDQAVRSAVAGGVDEDLLRELLEKADPQVLPTETLIAWIEHADHLSREGLPVSPVVSRYLQGLAKGISVPRIESAVGELEDRLRQAAILVDASGGARSGDAAGRLIAIDHTAYALGLGAPADLVQKSLALAQEEPSPASAAQAPVLTFGILVASGLADAVSFELVETAWQKGYRGDTLERLGKALSDANPQGGAPSQKVVQEVLTLLAEGTSEDQFFEGLDQIMGREGYRLHPVGIDSDALARTGRRGKDPVIETPKEQENRPSIQN